MPCSLARGRRRSYDARAYGCHSMSIITGLIWGYQRRETTGGLMWGGVCEEERRETDRRDLKDLLQTLRGGVGNAERLDEPLAVELFHFFPRFLHVRHKEVAVELLCLSSSLQFHSPWATHQIQINIVRLQLSRVSSAHAHSRTKQALTSLSASSRYHRIPLVSFGSVLRSAPL